MADTAFVVGLFFLRFWWETRDRFFALFALAFWIFGINRIVLAAIEERPGRHLPSRWKVAARTLVMIMQA